MLEAGTQALGELFVVSCLTDPAAKRRLPLPSKRDTKTQKILNGDAYKPGALVLILSIGDSWSSNASGARPGAVDDLPTQA